MHIKGSSQHSTDIASLPRHFIVERERDRAQEWRASLKPPSSGLNSQQVAVNAALMLMYSHMYAAATSRVCCSCEASGSSRVWDLGRIWCDLQDNHTDHRCSPPTPSCSFPPPHLQGAFGPVFLGDVSSQWGTRGGSSRGARRFIGCMRELRANSKEIYLLADGVRGRNIKNCDPPVCQHRPCRNGGTCVRYEVTPQITESVPKWPLKSKVVALIRNSCFPFQTFPLSHCDAWVFRRSKKRST